MPDGPPMGLNKIKATQLESTRRDSRPLAPLLSIIKLSIKTFFCKNKVANPKRYCMPKDSHPSKVKITTDISKDERACIKIHDKPNAETQKAMSDVDKKENLTHCNSIEEF